MSKKEYVKIPLEFDTPVPFYDLGVSCGLPNEHGDIPPEIMMMPCQLAKPSVFMLWAQGDSMEGVNIHSGDMLIMDNAQKYYNHDVVMAKIDGQCAVLRATRLAYRRASRNNAKHPRVYCPIPEQAQGSSGTFACAYL